MMVYMCGNIANTHSKTRRRIATPLTSLQEPMLYDGHFQYLPFFVDLKKKKEKKTWLDLGYISHDTIVNWQSYPKESNQQF